MKGYKLCFESAGIEDDPLLELTAIKLARQRNVPRVRWEH